MSSQSIAKLIPSSPSPVVLALIIRLASARLFNCEIGSAFRGPNPTDPADADADPDPGVSAGALLSGVLFSGDEAEELEAGSDSDRRGGEVAPLRICASAYVSKGMERFLIRQK